MKTFALIDLDIKTIEKKLQKNENEKLYTILDLHKKRELVIIQESVDYKGVTIHYKYKNKEYIEFFKF